MYYSEIESALFESTLFEDTLYEFTKFKLLHMYTLREKQALYKAHKAKSKSKKPPSAADFANCVEEPMFNAKDNERVLSRLPPEELHLHLGSVNKHVKELNKIWGENRFYRWCGFRIINCLLYTSPSPRD